MKMAKCLGGRIFNFLFFVSCFLLCALCSMLYASDSAGDEVARIQKAYESIKDVKGDFVQKSYIRDLKRTDTYGGRFFIKPPRMKWEFSGDKPQSVYITAEDIIIYQKKEKQAIRAKFDRATYGQAPIALLGGFGDINKEFDVSMKKGRLLLKPRKPMGIIVQIELTLSDAAFPIETLSILDTASNRIDITLKDVRVNSGLGEKIFVFTPPEGVSVFQQ
ncbi:MAG: outer membrane lipoprotein carrier protein LolA [Nitrospirae bacterium]|nr:outer membrane lipoprotein carrier protein LolA [Nitrospirota bacterium]